MFISFHITPRKGNKITNSLKILLNLVFEHISLNHWIDSDVLTKNVD